MLEIEVPQGVQAFNLWTIWIMARLWEEFPRPQYFGSTPTFVHVTSDHRAKPEPIGPQGQKQVEYFTNTLNWLMREGFASGVANAAGAFANVSLTEKGFSILNQVPTALTGKGDGGELKSLGTIMRDAISQYAPDFGAALILRLIDR